MQSLSENERTNIWRDYYEARDWGLDEQTAVLYVALRLLGRINGAMPLTIVSGFRSAEHQASLRRRWDAGNKTGLAVRPAKSSQHSLRRAFDVVTENPDLVHYGAWAEELGARWGGRFRVRDPGHFDLKTV